MKGVGKNSTQLRDIDFIRGRTHRLMADTSEHTREYHKLYYKNNKSKWSKTSKEYNKKYYQDIKTIKKL